jgi:tRNA(Ile)-lysidine synthase
MLLTGSAKALEAAELAALLDRIGGFEPSPRLAVGVSGGADSLSLCLLASDWAKARGGAVLALTVDHGLRAGSSEEAARVGNWLAARGIEHEILAWTGSKPSAGIQNAARQARRALLAQRCRERGILHLLLAHHRDDQAETVLLRLSRGSGPDGLAGMAAVRELGPCRLLRPLLGVPRARLEAFLRAAGQPWIEDPSNRAERFARARLRHSAAVLAREGLDAARLADTARRCGRARAALEASVAGLLAEAAEIHPEGWLSLDEGFARDIPEEVALRALARCLAVVGGAALPVRLDALERLLASVSAGTPRTLGGCSARVWRGRLAVVREAAAAARRIPVLPGGTSWWDRRFLVTAAPDARGGLAVARLGHGGWLALPRERREYAKAIMPQAAAEALPALWEEEGLRFVPGLGHAADGIEAVAGGGIRMAFVPAMPLCGAPFAVV